MDRKYYDAEHIAFAGAFRAFADKEIVSNFLSFERNAITPR
jgi:hypothetical protein